MGSVTSDVVRGMGVTQFVGVRQIARYPLCAASNVGRIGTEYCRIELRGAIHSRQKSFTLRSFNPTTFTLISYNRDLE